MPATPGDADDLAGSHGERHVVDHRDAAPVAHRQTLDLQKRDAGRRRLLVDPQEDAASDHQLGEFAGAGLARRPCRDDFAAAHDGHVVGDVEDLAQLVGDEDDRLALGPQLAEDGEELVGLGGCQHTRWLVEDQDLGAAIERLENFHPLLEADRQRLDHGVRVDRQPVLLLEAEELGSRAADAGRQEARLFGPSMMFSSTVKGSTSMKCWWTMPMPAAIAAFESGIATGWPPTRISPSSAW